MTLSKWIHHLAKKLGSPVKSSPEWPPAPEKLIITHGLTRIRYICFKQKENLKEVYLPVSVQNLEADVFYDYNNLTDIFIDSPFILFSSLTFPPHTIHIHTTINTWTVDINTDTPIGVKNGILFTLPKENVLSYHWTERKQIPYLNHFATYMHDILKNNMSILEQYPVLYLHPTIQLLAIQLCKNHLAEEQITQYITNNMPIILQTMLDKADIDNAVFLVQNYNGLSKENIDHFIEQAIDKKMYELQILLMHCKQENDLYDPTEKWKL